VWPDYNGNDVQEAGERITKTPAGDFKYFRNAYRVDPECPAAGCAWTPRLASSWRPRLMLLFRGMTPMSS